MGDGIESGHTSMSKGKTAASLWIAMVAMAGKCPKNVAQNGA